MRTIMKFIRQVSENYKIIYPINYPREVLELNIFNESDHGDVTEFIGSELEKFRCRLRAPLTNRNPTIVIRDKPIPPIIWYSRNGIIYQDLKYDRFEEAIQFLIENYIPFDTLSRAIDLKNNPDGNKEFCEAIRFLLKNDCSMIAVEERSNSIVGIVVMQIMRKDEKSWLFRNFLVNKSPIIRKLFGFDCNFMIDSLYTKIAADVDLSLHIFIVSIARRMKSKLLKEEIILHASKIARSIGASRITYIATSNNDKERAKRVGMKEIALKTYNSYLDNDNNLILTNVPAGENYAILFENCVAPKANISVGDWILYS